MERHNKLTFSIVVFEERIQAGSIDENILGAKDSQAPSLSASAGFAGAGSCKVGVIYSSIDSERSWGEGIWLVVPSRNLLAVSK